MHRTRHPLGYITFPKRPLQNAVINSKYAISIYKPHIASNSRSHVQRVVISRVPTSLSDLQSHSNNQLPVGTVAEEVFDADA